MSGLLILLTALVSAPASAITLSLVPSSDTAMSGGVINVDLVVDGLTAGGPDSLGAFDIDIGYDISALSLSSFSLDASLGDIGLGEAIDLSFGDLGGVVNVAEVSLLETDSLTCIFCLDPYLDDIQGSSFTLASFTFDVLNLLEGESTSIIIDTIWGISDGFGSSLIVDGIQNAFVSNPESSTAVPEPSALVLLAIGIIGIGFSRKRNRVQHKWC